MPGPFAVSVIALAKGRGGAIASAVAHSLTLQFSQPGDGQSLVTETSMPPLGHYIGSSQVDTDPGRTKSHEANKAFSRSCRNRRTVTVTKSPSGESCA